MPIRINNNTLVNEGASVDAFVLYIGVSTDDQRDFFFEPYSVSWSLVFTMNGKPNLAGEFNGYAQVTIPQIDSSKAGGYWTTDGQFQIDTDRVPGSILVEDPYMTWSMAAP